MASSNAWRSLQRAYRELGRLYDDVYPSVFSRQDWAGTVFARRSLGDEVPIEAWSLAEHYLLSWNNWHGLCQRYLRYFGRSEDRLPRSWRRMEYESSASASGLLRDLQLDELISESWSTRPAETGLIDVEQASTRSLYHAIVVNHERMMLLAGGGETSDLRPRESKSGESQGPVWPRCRDIALRRTRSLIEVWNELPRKTRDDTSWHLRQYRHANLLISWLRESDYVKAEPFDSALYHATNWEKVVIPTIEQFVEELDLEAEDRQTISRVLHRIQEAVAEIGYEDFVADITSSDFQLGEDTPIGHEAINLIPSDIEGPCCTTLLAVSKGEKRASGFPAIMQQVREHLIRCFEKTRVVVVVCDVWRPDILNDHIGDLRAHHDRGVRFLFLLAGTPARGVAPVAVDLGASP